ncbi:UDP-N-acetylmuramyl pentapeptide phosphotransferase/UDP-N-acetylglucosamine-1-phosphate transferase [Chitinophaga sp. W3I9]|uniref:MraY family glycosyltransferase n=1 Tax=unclassified Chitinophaga TaxID=2619133 RepID=UPI003D1D25C3
MIYLVLALVFFLTIKVYFKIAAHYNIIDKPNERSSHTTLTIRGGGIIFVVAALAALVWHFDEYWLPVLGMLIIGTVSFLDDIYSLPNRVRMIFQVAAVTMMLYYLQVFANVNIFMVILLYILVIGIINAYNFMDGINGITGLYSLVVLAAMQYVNIRQQAFISEDLIWLPALACVVFLFFNFRKKAACFAGDVGSVTIAFWIVTMLLKLIFTTGDWKYLLFLSVYGVDTILTIIHRLSLRQNIFKAHRLHFYQILANERKIPHLVVTSLYAAAQLLVNFFVIGNATNLMVNILVVCLPLVLVYIVAKSKLMHKTV